MLAAPRRALMALLLVVLTLVSGGCGKEKVSSTAGGSSPALNASRPGGSLQEVAPPGAVLQLKQRLDDHTPQLTIQAPADDAVLPAGPWTLRLQVQDWPLADAGDLGLGPHVVVQVDDEAPLRISDPDAAASLAMPELKPGSHRISVYAARPWGEAVKAPGASRQIRVHRVARNPIALPAPGSAQLLAASPDALQRAEPVLIDWLLLDAPLQNLRSDDASWRLRVSVNGDSFLVDRQTPLWLKGLQRGSNAVQLELLDGRGEPLNPPFNSLVREVVIGSGASPAWQRPSLSAADLALLSGEAPALPLAPAAASEPAPQAEPTPAAIAAPEPAEPEPVPVPVPEPAAEQEPEPEPVAMPEAPAATADPPAAAPAAAQEPPQERLEEEPAQADEPTAALPPEPAVSDVPSPETSEESSPKSSLEEPPLAALAEPPAEQPAERIAPASSLSGSARDQVNADGSLVQAPRRGPLAGLREKLGG